MTTKKIIDKIKDFFTVRNTLIVIICILLLILIMQNIHRSGGHQSYRNSASSMTTSRGVGLPGMMGGGYAGRRGDN